MITLQINFNVSSALITLVESGVQTGTFADAIALLSTTEPLAVVFDNGYDMIEGTALKSADDLTITITLVSAIVSPRGGCITFAEADDTTTTEDACIQPEITTVKDSLKFAIVDADGCITQYVTLAMIREYLLADLITGACDLFASTDVQPLVAGDEFVAINGCDLKRIAQADVKCEDV